MRRRLDLAMTLVGDPRIIFLDEPTTGLDPRSRRTMWEIIRELVAGGVTIFLTTQYLEEADQLADRIARARPRQADRRGHRRTSSSGSSPAATSGCSSPTRASSTRPPARSASAVRDDDALALRFPSDGSVASLRALLDRLDAESIAVDRPDGAHPRPRRRLPRPHRQPERTSAMSTALLRRCATRRRCCAATSAARCATRPRPPRTVGMPVVFLLLFVYVFGGTLGAGLAGRVGRARRLPRLRHARHPPDRRGRRGAGHGDLGRHGHDRGHRRPLPHDGDRPRARSSPATSSAA